MLVVAARWFVALAIAVGALAAGARAQDAQDEAPVDTLSEQPQTETDPEEADRKARELFKQGRAAYEDGRYRDAWDYFRQAYLLSKRPELLYNVGQSADRLRMDREALEAFKLYLAKLPDAENRREVENRVRALEERLGPQTSQDASAQPQPDPAYLTGEGEDEGAIFGEEPKADADATPASADGQPTRSGWQLRLALGLGLLGSSVSELAVDTTIGSATAVGHVSLGYDLARGVLLGGALLFEWGLSPGATQGGLEVDLNTANMVLLGPFLDYYFAPREHGWHALAGLAIARLSLSDTSGTVSSEDSTGGAVFLGGGYEWPAFDDEWAIGVLGRLIFASIGQDTGTHAIAALSVSGTAAWY
jgi:hypothetical protein